MGNSRDLLGELEVPCCGLVRRKTQIRITCWGRSRRDEAAVLVRGMLSGRRIDCESCMEIVHGALFV
jgi:hypothetical protein